jgi:hypothetical protein
MPMSRWYIENIHTMDIVGDERGYVLELKAYEVKFEIQIRFPENQYRVIRRGGRTQQG